MLKKAASLAVVFSAIAAVSYPATTDLVLNVRVQGGGHELLITTPGQEVTLELYATFTQPDSGLHYITLGIEGVANPSSPPTLLGDLSAPTKNSGLGSIGSAHNPGYDGLAHSDWGGTQPGTTVTGFFDWRNTNTTWGDEIVLGTIKWTAQASLGPGGDSTDISAFPYIRSATGRPGSYRYATDPQHYADGMYTSSNGLGNVVTGLGVHLWTVPEPSTLVLLGMACLALLAIRRRK